MQKVYIGDFSKVNPFAMEKNQKSPCDLNVTPKQKRISGQTILEIAALLLAFLVYSAMMVHAVNTYWHEKQQSVINGSVGSAKYYKRTDWLAQPPTTKNDLFEHQPINIVVISHTETKECFNESQCIEQVREIQNIHMEYYWADIAYNFLIGGDGGIYEGRGWDVIGGHTATYNNRTIGISLIGNFTDKLPERKQITALILLLEEGVHLNKISSNYKLLGQCQFSETESPGKKFYDEVLKKSSHWLPNV